MITLQHDDGCVGFWLTPSDIGDILPIAYDYDMPGVLRVLAAHVDHFTLSTDASSDMYVIKWLALSETYPVRVKRSAVYFSLCTSVPPQLLGVVQSWDMSSEHLEHCGSRTVQKTGFRTQFSTTRQLHPDVLLCSAAAVLGMELIPLPCLACHACACRHRASQRTCAEFVAQAMGSLAKARASEVAPAPGIADLVHRFSPACIENVKGPPELLCMLEACTRACMTIEWCRV